MKPTRLMAFVAAAAALAACSTGTADRRLFAHTEDETYARVRAAVPSGTPVDVAGDSMKRLGWDCYRGPPRSGVTPNDTHQRVYGPILDCDAYPSAGGYPFSKQYTATFLLEDGMVTRLQVSISAPGV